jgi:hypothetical protein
MTEARMVNTALFFLFLTLKLCHPFWIPVAVIVAAVPILLFLDSDWFYDHVIGKLP